MTSEFVVRQAEIQDAKKVFQFLCELEKKTFDYQEFYLNYRNTIFANNNIYLVAADQNNYVVGYISCHGQILLHHNGMVFEVQEFFVETPYRKHGIGTMLIKALETRLAKREFQCLEVTANVHRKDTHDFYLEHGFEQTHYKFTRMQHSKNEH
jgi:PhnO protein